MDMSRIIMYLIFLNFLNQIFMYLDGGEDVRYISKRREFDMIWWPGDFIAKVHIRLYIWMNIELCRRG